MQRTGLVLLVASAVLGLGSVAAGRVGAANPAGEALQPALQATDTPTPGHFVYLPLVTRDSGSEWVTIVEEGFEAPLSNLWDFRDADGASYGTYYWARRTQPCEIYRGDYSAWAVGGGANGAMLSCGANYPNNVDSWMAYGPFSLADAATASLSFQLWLNVDLAPNETLFVLASSDNDTYQGIYLTYQPSGWAPLTFYLDGGSPGVDMRGQPQVWVAFEFVSDGSVSLPGGAYVDDVVVRKCVGTTCPPVSSPASRIPTGRAERSRPLPAATPAAPPYGSGG
jgi:hypothetical protein